MYDYINTKEAHLILIDCDTWYIKKMSTADLCFKN